MISLLDEHGNWVTEQQQLKDMASNFYSELFRAGQIASGDFIKNQFPHNSIDKLHELEQDSKEEEVIWVIKEMNPYNTPGPDGFHAIFI